MDEKQESAETKLPPIPSGQQWFDRIFVLLIASILISGLLYNVWGLIELFVIRG